MNRFGLHNTVAAVVLTALISGCTSDLYLPETTVTAFVSEMRTGTQATQLFENLEGQALEIQFSNPPTGPRIDQTNTVDVLRALPRLALLEALQQVSLERLATLLDSRFQNWLDEEIRAVLMASDAPVYLQRLDGITVVVTQSPQVSYDYDTQTIQFDTTISITAEGRLHFVDSWADLDVTMSGLALHGKLRLSSYRDSARVEFTLNAELENVFVEGDISDAVEEGTEDVLRFLLSRPRNEIHFLSFDNFEIPLLGLGDRPTGVELHVRYRALPERAAPKLDVVARGEDGGLYHSFLRGGDFVPPSRIPLTETTVSDPALVAPAPGLLTLVAVTAAGNLLQADWNRSEWSEEVFGSLPTPPPKPLPIDVPEPGGPEDKPPIEDSPEASPLRSYLSERPALVATHYGQLEVIAAADEGGLYHLRKRYGRWQPPVPVPDLSMALGQALGSGPETVRIGQKILLVYLDLENRSRAMVFDLESEMWGNAVTLATDVDYRPAVAIGSEGRAHVISVGSGGQAKHRILHVDSAAFVAGAGNSGFGYEPETVIGGSLTGPATLITSGADRIELVARGPGRTLWHNHYMAGQIGYRYIVHGRTLSEGWQGWQRASARFFETSFFAGRIEPEIAGVATRSGVTFVMTRRQSGAASRLAFNRFPSHRYAREPWHTVHWRGLREITDIRFIGAPALAMSGRDLKLATADDTQRLMQGTLAKLPKTTLLQRGPSAVLRTDGGFPVISSAPGVVDFVFVNTNKQLSHFRRYNDIDERTIPVPGIEGADIRSIAVVAAGGDIETAAVTAEGDIYHWRFRGSAWLDPVLVGNGVQSAPALVDIGAGELELLAIGNDLYLHRWKFRSEQWTESPATRPTHLKPSHFGRYSASSYGDGRTDVVVAAAGVGELYHGRYEAFRELPYNPFVEERFIPSYDQVGFQAGGPVFVTAIGPYRAHLLIPNDGRPLSTWTTTWNKPPRQLGFWERFIETLVSWGWLSDSVGERDTEDTEEWDIESSPYEDPVASPPEVILIERAGDERTVGAEIYDTIAEPPDDTTVSPSGAGTESIDPSDLQPDYEVAEFPEPTIAVSQRPAHQPHWLSGDYVTPGGAQVGSVARLGVFELTFLSRWTNGGMYLNRHIGSSWTYPDLLIGRKQELPATDTVGPVVEVH